MMIYTSDISEELINMQQKSNSFVATAEAAFLAGLTDRQMNRLVDEDLVPRNLLRQTGAKRSFARLTAPFARFYFGTEDVLLSKVRVNVVRQLTDRILSIGDEGFMDLTSVPDDLVWKIEISHVVVDVSSYVQETLVRIKEVESAESLVTSDPQIMGGDPCFKGTRIPIKIVLDNLAAGESSDDIVQDYPSLTHAMLHAAEVYAKIHPRSGRPRKLGEQHPELTLHSSKTIKHRAA